MFENVGAVLLISTVFILIAQAIGLFAYYSKRNQYSKSAQNIATLLPAVVFLILVFLASMLWLLLAWWAEVDGIGAKLFSGNPPVVVKVGLYAVGGAIVNIFLSILVQLAILTIHPPKYKPRRRRRRNEPELLPPDKNQESVAELNSQTR